MGAGVVEGQTIVKRIHFSSHLRVQAKWMKLALIVLAGYFLVAQPVFGNSQDPSQTPNIFKPQSTQAHSIFHLSLFVLTICAVIFTIVFCLLPTLWSSFANVLTTTAVNLLQSMEAIR